MSTAFAPVLLQLFDDYGDVLAGGFVYTYAAGGLTPLVTYQDLGGGVENENPVELDAAGRAQIRLTIGTAYKFIVKNASGQTISTHDNIVVGDASASASTSLYVEMTYCETPGAQGFMGGEVMKVAATFPVNFSGAGGAVITNPGSTFLISIKKNGVEVGTASISTAGVFTFATTGGSTVSVISGDVLSFYGPSSVGTAANFMMTLVGAL